MTLAPVSYREVRLWRAADDGHFFLFVCFERLPGGGFFCPYAARFRNWRFMTPHIEDFEMRHDAFNEMSHPHAQLYATAEEATDAFDLSRAAEGL